MNAPQIHERLTRSNLLTAPFWLAERLVIDCLDESTNERIVEEVRVLNQRIQQFYQSQITMSPDVPPDIISLNLHLGLHWFYQKIPFLIPSSVLPRLSQQLVMFPADKVIDWHPLIDYFLGVSEGFDEMIGDAMPPNLINDYIKLQFVKTSQQLGTAGVLYDHGIVRQNLDELVNSIRQAAKYYLDSYWEDYRPPLKTALLKVQSVANSIRFEVRKAEWTGIPIDVVKRLGNLIDDKVYVNTMQKLLELHELKKDELSAQLALEEHTDVLAEYNTLISERPPMISIKSDQIEPLFQALQLYVSEENKDDLERVLSGKQTDKPIIIVGRPTNVLAYAFLIACKAGYIANAKTEICRWLAHWFRVNLDRKTEQISYEYVWELLRKSKVPAKRSRIDYKP